MKDWITDAMRGQQSNLLEQLKQKHPNATQIDVEWDFDSFLTYKPKLKYRIHKTAHNIKEKNI